MPVTWTALLVAGTAVCGGVAGCSLPNGMNDDCEWPSEATFALDLRIAAHERHLRSDVRAAEELGIRYDDSRSAAGRDARLTRDECDTKLFAEIAGTHSIGLESVRNARARLAADGPDWTIYLPLLGLYTAAAFGVARGMSARFQWADEKAAIVTAGVLLSVAISVALMASGHLWGGLFEMIRVGNTHMSYRAERLGWRHLGPAVFAFGVAVFWSMLIVNLHRSRLRRIDVSRPLG